MKSMIALVILRLISFLPLCIARSVGRGLGTVMCILRAKSYKVAKLNLALCYPQHSQQQIEKLAKSRMLHLGQTLFETPRLWRKSADWLHTKIIAIEGEGHLRHALDDDRGTILLVPHQGNWEVIGLWIAKQTTMTSLYQPPKLASLGGW
jgi:KDO2-lipid IV(A) lauroyltransferase